jgi:hypothetical protein
MYHLYVVRSTLHEFLHLLFNNIFTALMICVQSCATTTSRTTHSPASCHRASMIILLLSNPAVIIIMCRYIGWTNCTPSYTAENAIACRDDLNPAVCQYCNFLIIIQSLNANMMDDMRVDVYIEILLF